MADKVVEYLLKLRTEGREQLAVVAQEADAAAKALERATEEAKGLTDISIREVGDESADALKRTASAADDVGDAHRRAASDVGHFGDRAGQVGSNAAKLAGALDLVDSGAGETARTVADLADVGEVAANAATALGVSMGSVAAVMAPVAIAVAALAGTWALLNAELEEADQRNATAATAATTAQEAAAQWKTTLAQVNTEFALANSETDELTVRTQRSSAAIEEAAAAQRALLEAAAASARSEYAASGGSDRSALQVAERNLAAFNDRVDEAKTRAELLIEAEIRKRDALKADADAAKSAAEASRKLAEATAYAAEIEAQRAQDAAAAAAAVREMAAAEQGLRDLALLGATEQERINDAAERRVSQAIALYEVTRDQVALEAALAGIESDRVAKLNAAFNQSAQSATTTTPAGPGAGDTLSAVGAGISNPLSAISTAGGPIAAGVISIVQAVGDLDGTLSGLRELLANVGDNLASGGERLAQFLANVLGDLVPAIVGSVDDFVLGFVRGIPEIVGGLVQAIPSVAVAMVETMTPLFGLRVAVAFIDAITDPAVWLDVGRGIADSFVDVFRDFVESLTDIFGAPEAGTKPGAFEDGGFFDNLFSGSFAVGTDYVPRTGIALVHQGERIVPAAGTGSGTTAAMMGGGSGGVTVMLPPGLIYGVGEDIAREVGRAAERGIKWGS